MATWNDVYGRMANGGADPVANRRQGYINDLMPRIAQGGGRAQARALGLSQDEWTAAGGQGMLGVNVKGAGRHRDPNLGTASKPGIADAINPNSQGAVGMYGTPPAQTLGGLASSAVDAKRGAIGAPTGGILPTSVPSAGYAGGAPARSATGVQPSGLTTLPAQAGPNFNPADPIGSLMGGGNAPSVPAGGSPGYGVNVGQFLDPSMQFRMDQGMRALQNSAAGRGSLNSGDTLRAITDYGQGLASTEYGNAFNRATNARDFSYGVDRADQAFDYAVQNADRSYDYNRMRDLAQFGLQAAGQQASGANSMSGILASLLSNAGAIQGTSDIAGANNWTNIINQIIRGMQGNATVNAAVKP